jgi:hypothetical protein
MLHLKASQKTALDHTLRRKKLLALWAATTEELTGLDHLRVLSMACSEACFFNKVVKRWDRQATNQFCKG